MANPLDHGAQGNGHDDTTAILQALQASPTGTLYLATNHHVDPARIWPALPPNGITFTGPGELLLLDPEAK